MLGAAVISIVATPPYVGATQSPPPPCSVAVTEAKAEAEAGTLAGVAVAATVAEAATVTAPCRAGACVLVCARDTQYPAPSTIQSGFGQIRLSERTES